MPDRWIVISMDGLANLALGPYGSSWNATPNLDRLAASGTTWDRVVVESDDAAEALRGFWTAASGDETWLQACRRSGRAELFLAGDPAGQAQSQRIATLAGEAGFDHCTLVEVQLGEQPEEEIESTAIAQLVAALLERVQASAGDHQPSDKPDDKPDESWSILWLHSDLLTRHWDAPQWLFDVDADEDDFTGLESSAADDDDDEPPEDDDDLKDDDLAAEPDEPLLTSDTVFMPSLEPGYEEEEQDGEQPPSLVDTITPPKYQVKGDDHPDWVMTWMQTYGCQVRLIDQLIGLIVDCLDQLDHKIGLAMVGTSGMSFGQNGWIGNRVGPLRSTHIHVPVILYDPGKVLLRWPQLAAFAAVSQWMLPFQVAPGPAQWARLSESMLPRHAPASDGQPSSLVESPQVVTRSDRAQAVVTTAQWFYVQDSDGTERLFLKPDDRDDVNDVADRCRDVVERFGESR